MGQDPHGEETLSKGEFAQISKVSPGRVTQWIAEGKISASALVGEGRSARIRVRAAQADLKRNLDPNQMTANGVRTRIPGGPLVSPPAACRPETPSSPPSAPDREDENEDTAPAHDLAAERAALTREQRINWRLRNAEKRGDLIDAGEAERRWADAVVALRSRMLAVPNDLQLALPHLTAQDFATIDRVIRDAMDLAAGGA